MKTPVLLRAACILSLLLVPCATLPAGAQTASLVRDINTGEHGFSGAYFDQLTVLQGKMYFITPHEETFTEDGELWVSDGSAEGTRLLLDECPSEDCASEMSIYGAPGNLLFFTAGPTDRIRLWRSDGTRAGTFRLHPDLLVRPYQVGFSQPFTFFRGALYFVGCSRIFYGDCDLWRTDGSTAGTVRIKDFDSRGFRSFVVGNRLFLAVTDEEFNSSLWTSDGTTAGTVLVKAFGRKSLFPTLLGDRLFLHVSAEGEPAELWTSDGTPSGTRVVNLSGVQPGQLVPIGSRLYFMGTDPIHGTELWTTDGTAAGTRRLTGFGPDDPQVRGIASAGDRVVFVANDGLHGDQIWTTRGTPDSTAALPNPCSDCSFVSRDTRFVKTGGRLLFIADDGIHGSEPWVTDGTAQGTRLLADLCPATCGSVDFWETPLLPTSLGILFAASDTVHGQELWRTDGTAAGTVRLSDLADSSRLIVDTSSSPYQLKAFAVGPDVYFGVTDGTGVTLWKSEGLQASRSVAVVDPRGASSQPDDLFAFGDQLLFRALDSDGWHLWSSRGSSESTIPLAPALFEFRESLEPTAAGGLVFLHMEDLGEGSLWRTDGTPAGTLQLAQDVEAGITEWQGSLYFAKLTAQGQPQIWKSDGTPQGGTKVLDVPILCASTHLAGLGPELYIVVSDDFQGRQIWRTDGTQAGTRKVAEGRFAKNPGLLRIGSSVYFPDSSNVWKMDGTEGGTVPLLPSGREDSFPRHLTSFQGWSSTVRCPMSSTR